MVGFLKSAWTGVIDPLIRRPARVQTAALCYRTGKRGKEILLISSRGSGRWILPKGWPIDGLDGAGTAAQEAWEEAGVKPAKVVKKSIGTYHYEKEFDNGATAQVEASVYPIKVDKLVEDYPEVGQRKRNWVAPDKAAELVKEPELQSILRSFS